MEDISIKPFPVVLIFTIIQKIFSIPSLQGRYDYYEGGIELSAADAEDDGEWSCEFEDYYDNDNNVRGDGQIVKVKALGLGMRKDLCLY